jgi:hypothetical protein
MRIKPIKKFYPRQTVQFRRTDVEDDVHILFNGDHSIFGRHLFVGPGGWIGPALSAGRRSPLLRFKDGLKRLKPATKGTRENVFASLNLRDRSCYATLSREDRRTCSTGQFYTYRRPEKILWFQRIRRRMGFAERRAEGTKAAAGRVMGAELSGRQRKSVEPMAARLAADNVRRLRASPCPTSLSRTRTPAFSPEQER